MKLAAPGLMVCFGVLFGCSEPATSSRVHGNEPTSPRKPCTREVECADSERCIEENCEPLWQVDSPSAPGVRGLLESSSDFIRRLLADRGSVFWMGGDGFIDRINKLSFTGQRYTGVGSWQFINGFTVDAEHAYFSTTAGQGSEHGMLLSIPLTHQTEESPILDGLMSPTSLHVKDGFVYYADDNAIARVAITGGKPETVLPKVSVEDGGRLDLAGIDDAHLYFTTATSILRIPFAGKTAELPISLNTAAFSVFRQPITSIASSCRVLVASIG